MGGIIGKIKAGVKKVATANPIDKAVNGAITGTIDRGANSVAANVGDHGEASKLVKQTMQGTKDATAAYNGATTGDTGSAWTGIKAAAADGPSPAPVLNPGDKTKNGLGNSTGNNFVAQPAPNAPDRGAYQSYQNPDGTISTPLSAAAAINKLGSPSYAQSQASTAGLFQAGNAGPATAYNAQGGPATAASTAAAGKASNYLTDRATTVGPSAWLNLQMQNQDLAKQNALGNATAAAGGQNAAARSSLATKGGLSSGAAERIAKTGNQDLTLQKQSILNQDQQARLGLGAQDEATKTGLLGNAASLEQGLSQFNAGQTQQNAQYNLGQGNALSQFNAGQNQQNSQYNTNQANQIAQYNTTAQNQNAQYNTSNAQQNDQYNASQANNAKNLDFTTRAAASQYDIGNALNEGAAKRADDLAYYQEQMKDRAAGINANAIGTAGAGGAGKKIGG